MPSSSRASLRARPLVSLFVSLFVSLVAVAALAACGDGATPAPAGTDAVASPTGNLTRSCADSPGERRDYFPDKLAFSHATGIDVTYTDTTKLVEISRPWKDATERVRLLLVQCGTDVPEGHGADVVVPVPVRRVATFSTTQLPAFVALGRLDAVVAHGGLGYVTTPEVRQAAQAGRIAEVGDQTAPDLEALATAAVEVALVSAGIENDEQRVNLARVGPAAVPYGDWLEETLLGRAEWGKLVALLLNEEAAATRAFAAVERDYAAVVARAADLDTRPSVLVGAPYEGTWYMPAGESYVARALAELGARYPWADTTGTGALSLDMETVLARAGDADVWLGAGSTRGTLADLAATDERFGSIAAFRDRRVYADDAAATADGGNPVFELGAARPDLVLADLFKALYPDAADDVTFTFYGPVPAAADRSG